MSETVQEPFRDRVGRALYEYCPDLDWYKLDEWQRKEWLRSADRALSVINREQAKLLVTEGTAAPETAAERDRLREINAELLAALINLVDWFDTKTIRTTDNEIESVSNARAAIAKTEVG